jgi:hypothetical protein
MIRIIAPILLLLLPLTIQAKETSQRFAVAESPTPVLNTPEFDAIFAGKRMDGLKTDNCGQVRELEFIALPGTVFVVHQEIKNNSSTIYRVTTGDYPHIPDKGLFIDGRFTRTTSASPSPRQVVLLPKEEIIRHLRDSVGTDYIWGGNIRKGIPGLANLYPPKGNRPLSVKKKERILFAGLDCSGLLYEASGGWTPRNTGELVAYGKPVEIGGHDSSAIAGELRPLDLIVWPGHVLIALDHGEVIESRLYCDGRKSGVVIRPLRERLSEIMRGRRPANFIGAKGKTAEKRFVVRRWHEP